MTQSKKLKNLRDRAFLETMSFGSCLHHVFGSNVYRMDDLSQEFYLMDPALIDPTNYQIYKMITRDFEIFVRDVFVAAGWQMQSSPK